MHHRGIFGWLILKHYKFFLFAKKKAKLKYKNHLVNIKALQVVPVCKDESKIEV